jgi:hypothetical protein
VFARLFECQNCGGFNGFSSRPRSFAEKYILPMLFLRPVRCGDCSCRTFQNRFVPVQKRSVQKRDESTRSSKSGRAAAA